MKAGSSGLQRCHQSPYKVSGEKARAQHRLVCPTREKSSHVCWGILDSYRQGQDSPNASSPQKPAVPKRTRHPRGMTETPKQTEIEDDSICSPDCVTEVKTAKEFDEIVSSASPKALIIVDFYKTACGSCRYIQPGFVKLCRSSQEEHAPVVFLKHNVIDEYDQATDLGEKLKIRNVPLFQFYMDNSLIEQFATREKDRIGKAINHHVGWEVCHL